MINYKDIKNLGFKKHKVKDKIFKKKFGYNYFFLEYDKNEWHLEWSPQNRLVQCWRETKDGEYKICIIDDFQTLKNFINFIK